MNLTPGPHTALLNPRQVIPSIFSGVMREAAAPVWVQEPFSNFLFFVLTASIGYVFFKLAVCVHSFVLTYSPDPVHRQKPSLDLPINRSLHVFMYKQR